MSSVAVLTAHTSAVVPWPLPIRASVRGPRPPWPGSEGTGWLPQGRGREGIGFQETSHREDGNRMGRPICEDWRRHTAAPARSRTKSSRGSLSRVTDPLEMLLLSRTDTPRVTGVTTHRLQGTQRICCSSRVSTEPMEGPGGTEGQHHPRPSATGATGSPGGAEGRRTDK